MKARLFICGAGISVPDHLTIAALQVMLRSAAIYSILSDSFVRGLPTEIIGKFCSLNALYQSGEMRSTCYSAVVKYVMDATRDSGRDVCYLAQGNPVFFDSVVSLLIETATRQGIPVEIIPGISFVDTVMTDLQTDLAPGVQIFDASSLILHDIRLRLDTAALLVQMNVIGTARVRPSGVARTYAPLAAHLDLTYPRDHVVTSIVCGGPRGSARLVSFPLRALVDPPCDLGPTLYIPPMQQLQTRASAFEASMNALL